MDNFNIMPHFFKKKKKKKIDFYFKKVQVFTYVVTACFILLATVTQLWRNMLLVFVLFCFSPLADAIFKSLLLKMATTIEVASS